MTYKNGNKAIFSLKIKSSPTCKWVLFLSKYYKDLFKHTLLRLHLKTTNIGSILYYYPELLLSFQTKLMLNTLRNH